MAENYEDSYYAEDAIFMERNSRDFRRRIRVIDANTAATCELLRRSEYSTLVKDVYYPPYTTPVHYEHCRVPGGGYGGLFSVTFTKPEASRAFFDALPFHKGPSLGTNFTLACPYAVLGHYAELDWAEGYGVDPNLVRVSVGMEDRSMLEHGFQKALRAAKAAIQ